MPATTIPIIVGRCNFFDKIGMQRIVRRRIEKINAGSLMGRLGIEKFIIGGDCMKTFG
jgi:hypothetical protein